jgi:HPt (histidine-containing phosphotransfer) domain-containing protein
MSNAATGEHMLPLEQRIRELRHRYVLSLPDRIAAIAGAVIDDAGKIARADMLRRFHTIAGSASTFGFDDIATLAGQAESALSAASVPEVTPGETAYVTSCVAELRNALDRYLDDHSTDPHGCDGVQEESDERV